MRVDKYLKVSRLIKRRTVAAEACTGGRITINGKVAKASSEVKVGDIITITFGERVIKVKVETITEHALKADAATMYTVIEG
ncbi:MAG: RNA-binding S4 domain-containing protein [Clostridia bacterium]|nr:RNA-binding S4 domain-containing protein [Clostridia bacterium]